MLDWLILYSLISDSVDYPFAARQTSALFDPNRVYFLEYPFRSRPARTLSALRRITNVNDKKVERVLCILNPEVGGVSDNIAERHEYVGKHPYGVGFGIGVYGFDDITS